MLDRLTRMAVFLQVAERLSFSAAATRLGLSKSAVSAKVADLEREVGLPLLNRTTRRVSLTDAGRVFAEHARRAVAEAGGAFDALMEMRAAPRGLLRVAAPVAIGRQLIGPLVPDYLAGHSEVSIELAVGDALVDLAADGFDLCIRHTDAPPETHVAWLLRAVSWHLVAAPAYLARRGEPQAPADLAGHDCLFYLRDGQRMTLDLRRGAEEAAVAVGGRFRANGSEILRDAALGGLGIGLLPDYSVAPWLARGDLVAVLGDWTVRGSFGRAIHASRPWSPNVPPLVRSFVSFLQARLAP